MKKIILAMAITAFLSSSAFATAVWFDADGSGTEYNAVLIDYLNGSSGTMDVMQDLGEDGIFNNGDTSLETLNLEFGYYDGSLGNNIYSAGVVATASSLEGTIYDFSGPEITDAMSTLELNAALQSTTFGVSFTQGQTITLNQGTTKIADFTLAQGGTSEFSAGQNSTFTSQFGLDLWTQELTAGYFFKDENGSQGTDWSTILGDNSSIFYLAFADSSSNFIGASNDDTPDNNIKLNTHDNGTTIKFSAVPEPSTLLLLGGGLLGLGFLSRRKKKA